MKKKQLLAMLSGFGDDDDLLVEGWGTGFEEPTIYVAGASPRQSADFVSRYDSDYIADGNGKGYVIIGTSRGCTNL